MTSIPSTEADLDTPAIVVDLDRLEQNLARWQHYADDAGIANRPHIKTHKCVEIARRQLELGAAGITCQKLGEAEVMADAGITDILIPFNLLGERKLDRLAHLMRRTELRVSADDERLLDGLSRAAAAAERDLDVLVECDTGFARAGVATPGEAASLATAVEATSGLRFAGFLTYPCPPGSIDFRETAAAEARAAGLEVETISAGGTPAMWQAADLGPAVNEYRVGTYAYFDRNTIDAGAAAIDDVALLVLATVVSRPARDRAILDAGSKALTSDLSESAGYGLVLEAPGSAIATLSEEHGHVKVAKGDELELGQRVHVVPNHVCPVSNLFDELWVRRGEKIVDRYAIAARGRSA